MQHEMVMNVLNDPLATEILHSPLLTALAYNGIDGAPRVVPVGYFWNGSLFIVCTATNAPKVRALAADPRVALSIDTDSQPPHILLVRGRAGIEIVDGVPAEFLEASKKSLPPDQLPAFAEQSRALYPQMARITIEPEWAKLLDFETRFPVAVQELITGKP